MKYYLFGSENSLDYDILVECDYIPKDIHQAHVICKEFNDKLSAVYTDKKINCNLITVKDNEIINYYKGTIDELNNCLFYTYDLHKQAFPNPILKSVERDLNEKILRVSRFILTFYSRTELRKEIKCALRSNLLQRLAVLKKIDFKTMTEFTDKKEKTEDIYKILAFQLGQVLLMINNKESEIYTKNRIINNFPELSTLLNRGKITDWDLYVLNVFLRKFIEYIELNINNLRLEERIKDI